jgi:uncharacterized coiled-coil protein SlyX
MAFEKEPTEDMRVFNTEIAKMSNMNTSRIRALEQRLTLTESRISALEEKIIEEIDYLRKSFGQISVDIRSLTETLSQIRTEMLNINKNLDKTARKSEVKELESLIDLYSPIKSKFVTREEVERLLEEKTEKKV